MTIALSRLSLLLTFASFTCGSSADNRHMRQDTPRLREKGSFNNLQATLRVFQHLEDSPTILETDEVDADNELMDLFDLNNLMSMPTIAPSDQPSDVPSSLPSAAPSKHPSANPSAASPSAW